MSNNHISLNTVLPSIYVVVYTNVHSKPYNIHYRHCSLNLKLKISYLAYTVPDT
jgi:hypothetical protein